MGDQRNDSKSWMRRIGQTRARLVGVGRWPTECLRPVRGKALGVLRVVTVAERMANHFVL